MSFRLRLTLFVLAVFFSLVVLGPLFIPIAPLKDTLPEAQLADEDSRFVEVKQLSIHYKTSQLIPAVPNLAFVFFHGYGSSLATWREVMEPLAELRRVIAFDRPAFGLSERPLPGDWQGLNPYSPKAQLELSLALLDELDIDKAVLLAHSTAAPLALQLALEQPGRVQGLVLVAPSLDERGGPAAWLRPLIYTPQFNRLGPLFMRQMIEEPGLNVLRAAWSKPESMPEVALEAYLKPFKADDWDRALWEYTKANPGQPFGMTLSQITIPTLVISGAEDRIVPVSLAERANTELVNGSLAVFEACGHIPQEECPVPFIEVVSNWLADNALLP
jgi:pimeloyl-ACP methyl ester carboxylesterase